MVAKPTEIATTGKTIKKEFIKEPLNSSFFIATVHPSTEKGLGILNPRPPAFSWSAVIKLASEIIMSGRSQPSRTIKTDIT